MRLRERSAFGIDWKHGAGCAVDGYGFDICPFDCLGHTRQGREYCGPPNRGVPMICSVIGEAGFSFSDHRLVLVDRNGPRARGAKVNAYENIIRH